jgi:hypothetical protein
MTFNELFSGIYEPYNPVKARVDEKTGKLDEKGRVVVLVYREAPLTNYFIIQLRLPDDLEDKKAFCDEVDRWADKVIEKDLLVPKWGRKRVVFLFS